MSEQAMDLRSSMATLRRRRRTLAAAGTLGLGAAVAFVFLYPPRLDSTTLVLLTTPTTETVTTDVETQLEIVGSASILGAAGKAVTPQLTAREVGRRVDVSAPTQQLIRITASSAVASHAQNLSQAIADAYVTYVQQSAQRVASPGLDDLRRREADLTELTKTVQTEIQATTQRRLGENPNSPEGKRDGQLVAQLRAEQADVSLRLDKVKGDIARRTPLASSAQGASVVQSATPAVGDSHLLRTLTWGPFGFVVGVAVVAVLLLVFARRDPRLRFRDEIADAAGSPVLADVRSRPQRSVAGWLMLLKSYEPSAVDAMEYRRLLRELVPMDGLSAVPDDGTQTEQVKRSRFLTVVTLSGDSRGLAVGPQLAAYAASMGIRTRMSTAEEHGSAAALWAACATDQQRIPRPDLILGHSQEETDLTIVLLVVDRRNPSVDRSSWAAATLLAIGSAFATEEELARLAVAVDEAGCQIDGIVVADPDRSDRTTGRHSVGERTQQVSLPLRLTGVVPLGVHADKHARARR